MRETTWGLRSFGGGRGNGGWNKRTQEEGIAKTKNGDVRCWFGLGCTRRRQIREPPWPSPWLRRPRSTGCMRWGQADSQSIAGSGVSAHPCESSLPRLRVSDDAKADDDPPPPRLPSLTHTQPRRCVRSIRLHAAAKCMAGRPWTQPRLSMGTWIGVWGRVARFPNACGATARVLGRPGRRRKRGQRVGGMMIDRCHRSIDPPRDRRTHTPWTDRTSLPPPTTTITTGAGSWAWARTGAAAAWRRQRGRQAGERASPALPRRGTRAGRQAGRQAAARGRASLPADRAPQQPCTSRRW